ncbi:pyridoxine/pyridoxamine 5'-phosphate oxidase [Kitasatospora kifunensis]|uniref:Pyridoxamine 5'-phosphate oxidase n=1 Tax=Kitasatospora kifunensis TaxID=58351 RepID=A0A7W7VYW3_KITKI|nr:pyridoxine 5'-phosphate oxidase C-terminal domain-containing protein [Kitasatospora kifunensis]MBB4927119.1 pyridoxamine 5'-phosphate oxidase [Kitasatospora kifunensis]
MTPGEYEETPEQRLTALRELLIHQPAMARELPGFDVEQAPADPAELFVAWLLAALRDGVPDAQVLTLSTEGLDGGPDARIVALRDVDPAAGEWWLAGDVHSPKGRQLAACARAALTWYWPALGRQVRVRGAVRTGSAAAAGETFRLLSPKSRVASLVGRQSEPLGEAAEFSAAWAVAERELAADQEIVAAGYTQYAVRAEAVEFWQGAAERRHVRLAYRRPAEDGQWTRRMLWP